MRRNIFVHSDNNKESREKLQWLKDNGIEFELLDFELFPHDVFIVGVPTLYILADGWPVNGDNVCAMLFGDAITLENIQKDYPDPIPSPKPIPLEQQVADLREQLAQRDDVINFILMTMP